MRIITKIIEFFKEVKRRVKEKEKEEKLYVDIIPVSAGSFKPHYVIEKDNTKRLAIGYDEENEVFVILDKYGWEIKGDVYESLYKNCKVDKRFIGKRALFIEKKDLIEY